MTLDNDYLVLKKVKGGSANRHGEVIDARVERILDKFGNRDDESPLARIKLVTRADYILTEVLLGHVYVESKGRGGFIKSGEWIFLYKGDKIMLEQDGTYEVQPQNL